MPVEKKSFLGGLNSDVEDRMLPQGDYRYALNIRASKSDGANEGAIENTKGNVVASFVLEKGLFKCIGAYDHLKTNKVYYFIFNSQGKHRIVEFDVNTNTSTYIILGDFLNFSLDRLILEQNIAIIDDLMFWLDVGSPPKKINIAKAKSGEIVYNGTNIQAVKPSPSFPPQNVVFESDNTVSTNSVRNKLFQFRYKWVYSDNEESAWSPISKVALPVDETQYRPNAYYPLDLNNLLSIDIDLGTPEVKRVKIASREGNLNDFYLVEDIDKSKLGSQQLTGYTYKFYNNETYSIIDNSGSEGMRLFDWFPLLANAQSLIDGNRIVYSGITEAFDPVDIDMDIDPVYSNVANVEAPQATQVVNNQTAFSNQRGITPDPIQFFNGADYLSNSPSQFAINSNSNVYWLKAVERIWDGYATGSQADITMFGQDASTFAGAKFVTGRLYNSVDFSGVVTVGIRYTVDLTIRYYNYGLNVEQTKIIKFQHVSSVGQTSEDVANQLRNKINAYSFSDYYVDFRIAARTTSTTLGVTQLLYAAEFAYLQAGTTGSFPKWFTIPIPCVTALSSVVNVYASWTNNVAKNLKQGASHGLALVYYDFANRSTLSNTTKKKLFYIKHPTERNIPSGYLMNITSVDLAINHPAPDGFTHYQVVYTGNQTIERYDVTEGYKGFIQCKLNNVANGSTLGTLTATLNELSLYNSVTPEIAGLSYNFTKGDRIRFVMDASENYLQGYVDVEVLSYDTATETVTFKKPDITVSTGFLIEIYSPKTKTETPFYYEIGEAYPIVDNQHYGDKNQVVVGGVTVSPAKLNLKDLGDVYLRYRTSPTLRQIEDYNYSDFYDSDAWDKGRPNVVDDNIKQVYRPTTMRYSDPYIPETNINGLSTFNDFSFEAYDQNNGDIMLTYPDQKSLIVFQQLRTGQVGIGQNTMYGNDGNVIGTVRNETKVLSDIRYFAGEFGIGSNPESFAVYGNSKYFADAKRGAILRLGGDGITPISEYSMHNFFNDTLELLDNSNTPFRLMGVYDVRFGEYVLHLTNKTSLVTDILTIEDSLDAIEYTLAFSEIKNRWTTFYSYLPDFMVSNRVGLITFKDGQLYKHNSNELYNNFYDVQNSTVLRFLSNAEPNKIKFYNNIFLESSHVFSMPAAKNQFGQETSLIEDDFTDEEGVFKAAFLMDSNTPNVDNPLIEGDNMRCHSMEIEIQNSNTELVKIFSVGINLNLSELTDR